MNNSLVERLRKCTILPSMPAVALKVLDLVRRDAPAAQIAQIVSNDPALASRLLRTVNSSFYKRSNTVSTVNHAVVVLGVQSVRTLVLGFTLVSQLKTCKTKGFDHQIYWKRSLFAAAAAGVLAERNKLIQREECMLAALLADIGMLALDEVVGEQYIKVHASCPSHAALAEAERTHLGMTHAEAAGFLVTEWKLPSLMGLPILYHHEPQKSPDAFLGKVAALVGLAGRCADVFIEKQAATVLAEVRKTCADQFGISREECDKIMNEVCQRTKELAPLLEVSAPADGEMAEILRQANETLVTLSVAAQQQTEELAAQNIVLRELAMTDGLTGLSSRGHFNNVLKEKFSAARSGAPLSLIMLDLDHFKMVNDLHGHQAGDRVLVAVAERAGNAARKSDLAARYGGEEMAIVLPNTPLAMALEIAERLRRAIASIAVKWGETRITVTASFGVAAHHDSAVFENDGALVRAADAALYASKAAGRNCVRSWNPDIAQARPRRVA